MSRLWLWGLAAGALLLAACQAASPSAPGAPSGAAPRPQAGASAPSAPAASAAPAAAPAAPAGQAARELKLGDAAPDFTLQDQNRQEVRLSQFRGRPVQVAFYVYAFSGG